jgi:hypothetical protein
MPGKTQRKYIGEVMRFNKSLKIPLHKINSVLPMNYTKYDIVNLFKELYPYEWNIIKERYNIYKSKDDFLKKVGKKIRYKPTLPKYYLFELQKVKYILSKKRRKLHKINFNEDSRLKKYNKMQEDTKNRMLKIKEKITLAKENIQDVEPSYIDIFIQSYHQKGISQDEKMEIVKELQKYDCNKSLEFFQKLNDSERNSQLRIMAFKHLQKIGKYVILRKGFKGKRKSYMLEKTNFNMKPLDLLQNIKNNLVQNKKSYDLFISHSFKDNELVIKIIQYLNKFDLNIYCDWISDNDFLKRKYASDYTKMILKRRIEQSNKVLFIKTENTNDKENNFYSEWVEMEILYAKEIEKPIECIDYIVNVKQEFTLYKYNKEIKDLE